MTTFVVNTQIKTVVIPIAYTGDDKMKAIADFMAHQHPQQWVIEPHATVCKTPSGEFVKVLLAIRKEDQHDQVRAM